MRRVLSVSGNNVISGTLPDAMDCNIEGQNENEDETQEDIKNRKHEDIEAKTDYSINAENSDTIEFDSEYEALNLPTQPPCCNILEPLSIKLRLRRTFFHPIRAPPEFWLCHTCGTDNPGFTTCTSCPMCGSERRRRPVSMRTALPDDIYQLSRSSLDRFVWPQPWRCYTIGYGGAPPMWRQEWVCEHGRVPVSAEGENLTYVILESRLEEDGGWKVYMLKVKEEGEEVLHIHR
jgi:rubrerythrin